MSGVLTMPTETGEKTIAVRHITYVVYDDQAETTTVYCADGTSHAIKTTTDVLYRDLINRIK